MNIEKHYTWDILDSSKIQTFMECPRKFFYSYIVGWEKDIPNVHLIFGEAWHRAMEHLTLNGHGAESVNKAFEKFDSYYTKEMSKKPENATSIFGHDIADAPVVDTSKKNSNTALMGLVKYVKTFPEDAKHNVLHTEVSGKVPVADDRFVHFRLDTILETEEGILTLDHKTGSKFSMSWAAKWELSLQMATYIHVLYTVFPFEKVYGAKINGAFFTAKDVSFERVPVRKTKDMLTAWLAQINYYIDMIQWNTEKLLEEDNEEKSYMESFPMNTQSCTNYGLCPFHGMCTSWSNPLRKIKTIPIGFKEKRWDPTKREVIDLEKKVRTEMIDGKLVQIEVVTEVENA